MIRKCRICQKKIDVEIHPAGQYYCKKCKIKPVEKKYSDNPKAYW